MGRLTAAAVCLAAGITPQTLKNWVSRQPPIVLLTDVDRPGGIRGVPNLFSMNRVMQIAIMAELVRLGWSPSPAALAAIKFSDLGQGSGGYGHNIPPLARLAGQLFPSGDTLLIARPPEREGDLTIAEIVNVPAGESWTAVWQRISTDLCASAATIVDVSALALRVRRNLQDAGIC